jgi:hypothetical protein
VLRLQALWLALVPAGLDEGNSGIADGHRTACFGARIIIIAACPASIYNASTLCDDNQRLLLFGYAIEVTGAP